MILNVVGPLMLSGLHQLQAAGESNAEMQRGPARHPAPR